MAGLEDFDDMLETATRETLGDTIVYRIGGTITRTFKAIAEHGDVEQPLAGSKAIVGDCAVEVPRSIVAQPGGLDEIELPRRPGEVFQPKNFRLDETGVTWLIVLKKKPA